MKRYIIPALVIICIIVLVFYIYKIKDKPVIKDEAVTEAPVYSSLCVPPVKDIDWYSSDRKAPLFDGLSGIDFKISTKNPEVQKYFNQGLMLAYGFNHAEAARSFYQGTREDPGCAMCYWGYAYVLGPNYNAGMEPGNFDRAWEAIQKALELSDGCKDLEKALIFALAERYAEDPPDDRSDLDQAYANAMKKVYNQFPDNSDVATMYAESLMDLHPWDLYDAAGNPRPWTAEIVGTLEKTINDDPGHAGSHHLYIHAVEASADPGKGLLSAEALFNLVPGSSHLLHMPSHIYINTGHYHEGSIANIRAVAVDSSYVTACHAQGVYPLAYYPHNYHFLAATATLEGDSQIAMMAAEKVSELVSVELMRDPAWSTLQHYYIIPYHVAVKFGLWDEIMKMENDGAKLPYPESVRHYARGMAYLAQKGIKSAKHELYNLELAMKDPVIQELTVWEINPMSTLVEISREILYGEILAMVGKYEESITALEKAIELEDGLHYNEPPDWFFSVRHHLGDVLVEAGRYEQAIEVYQQDLLTFPSNGWAYAGLYKAYIGSENYEEAGRVRMNYEEAFRHSDIDLAGSRIMRNKEYISMK